MKRWIALLLCVICLAIFTFGCSKNNSGHTISDNANYTGPVHISVLLPRSDDWSADLQRQLERLGEQDSKRMEFTFLSAEGDAEAQRKQMKEQAQTADVLLVGLVQTEDTETVLDAASERDIPVVFFGAEPDLSLLQQEDTRYVGMEEAQPGTLMAELLIDLWQADSDWDLNDDAQLQLLVLQAQESDSFGSERTAKAMETFEQEGVNVQAVDTLLCANNAADAKMKMEDFLQRSHETKVEALLCTSDELAQGALAAMREAGLNTELANTIPVVSTGGSSAAKGLIAEKAMAGTMQPDFGKLANVLVDGAVNLAVGKDFLDSLGYEYDASGVAIRLEYQPYTGEE